MPMDPLNSMCLLVVEDAPLDRDSWVPLLTVWGCRVLVTDGPEQACDLLRGGQVPDLIVSDDLLGGSACGIATVHALRRAAGLEIPAA